MKVKTIPNHPKIKIVVIATSNTIIKGNNALIEMSFNFKDSIGIFETIK